MALLGCTYIVRRCSSERGMNREEGRCSQRRERRNLPIDRFHRGSLVLQTRTSLVTIPRMPVERDNAPALRFLTETPLMPTPFALALGVDLGGTKIEAVVVRPDPFVEVARLRVPTVRDDGYDAVLARTAEAIRAVARQAAVSLEDVSIGVGMPGSIRRADGTVKNSNTTCLNGRPFREDLQALLGRPVVFENDANCFALAETLRGAGRPYAEGIVF